MRGSFPLYFLQRRMITTASTHNIFSLRLPQPRPDVFIGARQIPVSSLPSLSLGHAYLIGQRQCCNTSDTQSPPFSSDDLLDTSSPEVPKSMKMELVRIISTENIKPTSPTPLHLRTYKLSLLDQLFSHTYVPLVFFYPNNRSIALIHERSQLLKQSLSEALTRFYPFAGKIKDDLHIDCNDEGVYYVEAQINNRLSDFLNHPNDQMIHPLIPYDPRSMDSIRQGGYVVMIQANFFNCGGIAISMCTSHKIIDGITCTMFLKAWASIASGSSEQIYPSFIAPSLFPQNSSLPQGLSGTMLTSKLKEVKFITKRFVFDVTALVALKAKASNPSRVVAVATLIWKCGIAASRARNGFQKPSVLSIAVNLRRRFSPNLPEYCVGNLIWNALSQWMPKTELKLYSMMCRHVNNAIAKINSDFVTKIAGDDGALKVSEQLQEIGKVFSVDDLDHFAVTSLCNSGVYDADFGWGKPIWSYINTSTTSINFIFLMDTRSGNGIEAWVTLNEQDMAIVERDPELLSFASLNPSPLK